MLLIGRSSLNDFLDDRLKGSVSSLACSFFYPLHALHVSPLGCPSLSPFSWAMKIATTKVNQETVCARHGEWNRSFKNSR